jgi:hypothetical protein
MSGKSSSLKELKNLREAVIAEEKARTQALLENLPESQLNSPIPEEQQVDSSELAEMVEEEILDEPAPAPVPLPAPPRKPSPPPPQPRPTASIFPSPAQPTRPKAIAPKEPALIIPLTPKIQERIQRNVENARWSPTELVIELIRVSLHRGYPAIEFGDQVLAKAATYRTIERNPFEAVLKLVTGQGVFAITVRPGNPEYQHWLAYYQAQEIANPEKSASQVCLHSLEAYLQNVEDFRPEAWVKIIPPDAYSLAPG